MAKVKKIAYLEGDDVTVVLDNGTEVRVGEYAVDVEFKGKFDVRIQEYDIKEQTVYNVRVQPNIFNLRAPPAEKLNIFDYTGLRNENPEKIDRSKLKKLYKDDNAIHVDLLVAPEEAKK